MVWERGLIALILIVAVLQCLRALLPFRARVALARHAQGRVPDRLIVWFAGQSACEACGGRGPVRRADQRTK
jgi:hypothetical protein